MNRLFNFYKNTLYIMPGTGFTLGVIKSYEYLEELDKHKPVPYLYRIGTFWKNIITNVVVFGFCHPISVPYYYWKTRTTYLNKKIDL